MTRNLYLGADLFRLFGAGTVLDPTLVADRFQTVSESAVEARLAAVAAEIRATAPAVVGLQEVALVRIQAPSDYVGGGTPNAPTVVHDFLDTLLSALGPEYGVAASVGNADEEFPAESGGRRFDVRLTDRDVILVRRDVEVRSRHAGTYWARLTGRTADGTVLSVRRGYCLASLRIGGTDLTAVTTHLEAASSFVRYLQAMELRSSLDGIPGPVVVLGDFNAVPGDATYRLLTQGYRDAWAEAVPDASGDTCCQSSDLRNDVSRPVSYTHLTLPTKRIV